MAAHRSAAASAPGQPRAGLRAQAAATVERRWVVMLRSITHASILREDIHASILSGDTYAFSYLTCVPF